jgi:hypothetical protein
MSNTYPNYNINPPRTVGSPDDYQEIEFNIWPSESKIEPDQRSVKGNIPNKHVASQLNLKDLLYDMTGTNEPANGGTTAIQDNHPGEFAISTDSLSCRFLDD